MHLRRALLCWGMGLVAQQGLALRVETQTPKFSPLSLESIADYNFEGTVALNNCSGSLVRFKDSKDTDPGMMLTNGHCVSYQGGFLPTNKHVFNEKAKRSVTFLSATATSLGTINTTRIIYATMTGTDIGLYELEKTFAAIEKDHKVKAFTLDWVQPEAGQEIEIMSGYWRSGFSCSVDTMIHQVKEGDYIWKNSLRYKQPGCETIHGTSGSPVIDKADRKIVGIHNTTNDDGEKCTWNNPCEINEDGTIAFKKGTRYGQQTHIIYSCINEQNVIDLKKEGCELLH